MSPPPVTDATSLAVEVLDGLLVLAAVCIAAYLAIRFGLGRLGKKGSGRGMIRVLARADLSDRRSLYAVRIGGRTFLIGSSEAGIHSIAELDPDELPHASERSDRPGFSDIVSGRAEVGEDAGEGR